MLRGRSRNRSRSKGACWASNCASESYGWTSPVCFISHPRRTDVPNAGCCVRCISKPRPCPSLVSTKTSDDEGRTKEVLGCVEHSLCKRGS